MKQANNFIRLVSQQIFIKPCSLRKLEANCRQTHRIRWYSRDFSWNYDTCASVDYKIWRLGNILLISVYFVSIFIITFLQKQRYTQLISYSAMIPYDTLSRYHNTYDVISEIVTGNWQNDTNYTWQNKQCEIEYILACIIGAINVSVLFLHADLWWTQMYTLLLSCSTQYWNCQYNVKLTLRGEVFLSCTS